MQQANLTVWSMDFSSSSMDLKFDTWGFSGSLITNSSLKLEIQMADPLWQTEMQKVT